MTETTVSGSGAVSQYTPTPSGTPAGDVAGDLGAWESKLVAAGIPAAKAREQVTKIMGAQQAPASTPAPAAAPVAQPTSSPSVADAVKQRDALRQIEAKKQDADFVRRLTAGDVAAKQEWNQLHEAAAPRAMPEAAPAEAPKPDPTDPAGAFTAAAPGDFEIPSMAEPGVTDAQLVDAAQQAQDMLASMELPKEIGDDIARNVHEFEKTWRGMDDNAKQLHNASVTAKLDQMTGGRGADRVGLARLLLQAMEEQRPGAVDFAWKSGAGSNLAVIVQMANHAERLAQRDGRSIESLRNEFPALFR